MMKWFKRRIPHSPIIRWLNSVFAAGWTKSSSPQELLEKNKSWVYACIQRNVSACAQTPLRLYKKTNGENAFASRALSEKENQRLYRIIGEGVSKSTEFEEILEHPLLDLLKNVNPWQNAYDLKYLTFCYLETLGCAFWYLEKDANGKILNIWPLIASDVEIIPNETNGIKEFRYGKGLEKRVFQPNDVIYFQNPSLLDFWGTSSPLMAAEQAADMLDSMNRMEITLFRKGGRPDAILEIPSEGFISEEERRRLESGFSRFTGVENQGGLIVVSGGAKLTPFGITPREMNYLQGRKAALEEICAIFGVPMSFVLIQEVSRANAFASMELWKNYTIEPRLRMVEQKLNEKFTPHFGSGLYLIFEDPTPKDEEYRLRELQIHLSTNYSSINEERAKDGLPPVDWGERPIFGFSMNPSSTNSAEEEANQTENESQTKERQKRTFDFFDETEYLIRSLHAQLAVVFHRFLNESVSIYEKMAKERAICTETRKGKIEFLKKLPLNKWAKTLEAEIVPFLKGAILSKSAEVLSELNPSAKIDASEAAMNKALRKRRPVYRQMAHTAGDIIAEAVRSGIEAGEGAAEIANRIRTAIPVKDHADRIARTELIWAHNEAAQNAWLESGVVAEKIWDASADMRCCEECKSMHGKRIAIDGAFLEKDEGLSVLSRIEHPPLHPNCRCAILPVIKE